MEKISKFTKDEWMDKIKELNFQMESDDNSAYYIWKKGLKYLEHNRFDSAIEKFNQAIERDTSSVAYRNYSWRGLAELSLGLNKKEKGLNDEAEKLFKQAIKDFDYYLLNTTDDSIYIYAIYSYKIMTFYNLHDYSLKKQVEDFLKYVDTVIKNKIPNYYKFVDDFFEYLESKTEESDGILYELYAFEGCVQLKLKRYDMFLEILDKRIMLYPTKENILLKIEWDMMLKLRAIK